LARVAQALLVEILKLMAVLAQILYLTLLPQLVVAVVEKLPQMALAEALVVAVVVILERVVLEIPQALPHHKEITVAMPLLLVVVAVAVHLLWVHQTQQIEVETVVLELHLLLQAHL